jgi:hypothetical protein
MRQHPQRSAEYQPVKARQCAGDVIGVFGQKLLDGVPLLLGWCFSHTPSLSAGERNAVLVFGCGQRLRCEIRVKPADPLAASIAAGTLPKS